MGTIHGQSDGRAELRGSQVQQKNGSSGRTRTYNPPVNSRAYRMPPVDFKGGYNRRKVSKPLCLVGLADHLADGFPELTGFSSLPFSFILSRRRFDGAQCPMRLLSLIDGDSASILEMQPRSIPPNDRYRTWITA